MSLSATVQVVEVTTRQVGKDNPRTMWALKDGNGNVYTTFVPGIGNAAIQYEGRSALIDYKEEQKGQYLNRYLDSIHPAPERTAGSPEAELDKEPVDWDAKERRDFRSRAWAQAISATLPTIKPDETAKQIYTRVKPLAQAIYKDVCGDFAEPPPAGASGASLAALDDDIPFAPSVM